MAPSASWRVDSQLTDDLWLGTRGNRSFPLGPMSLENFSGRRVCLSFGVSASQVHTKKMKSVSAQYVTMFYQVMWTKDFVLWRCWLRFAKLRLFDRTACLSQALSDPATFRAFRDFWQAIKGLPQKGGVETFSLNHDNNTIFRQSELTTIQELRRPTNFIILESTCLEMNLLRAQMQSSRHY